LLGERRSAADTAENARIASAQSTWGGRRRVAAVAGGSVYYKQIDDRRIEACRERILRRRGSAWVPRSRLTGCSRRDRNVLPPRRMSMQETNVGVGKKVQIRTKQTGERNRRKIDSRCWRGPRRCIKEAGSQGEGGIRERRLGDWAKEEAPVGSSLVGQRQEVCGGGCEWRRGTKDEGQALDLGRPGRRGAAFGRKKKPGGRGELPRSCCLLCLAMKKR